MCTGASHSISTADSSPRAPAAPVVVLAECRTAGPTASSILYIYIYIYFKQILCSASNELKLQNITATQQGEY